MSPSDAGTYRRARLPPRSRSGCWTCRVRIPIEYGFSAVCYTKIYWLMFCAPRARQGRKVKCDERRPECAQCARLGHDCDYSPRLYFRDDTVKIMEKMQDISISDTIWDATLPVFSPSSRSLSPNPDTLPPFPCLTNDFEREMKAECSRPGTYIVVFKPESFASLPEYAGGSEHQPSGGIFNSTGMDSPGEYPVRLDSPYSLADDPNVVILSRFEDSLSSGCGCHKAGREAALPPNNTLGLTPKTDTECYVSPEPSEFDSPGYLDPPALIYARGSPPRHIDGEVHQALLRLHHDLLFLTAELGWLASRWRLADLGLTSFCASSRSERFNQARYEQQALRQLWDSAGMAFQEQPVHQLTRNSRELLQKCRMTFHSALLFSYTSMWSTQRLETGELPAAEIEEHASNIFDVANDVLQQGHLNAGFIVFPVFVAGVASTSSSLKRLALDLLLVVEKNTTDKTGNAEWNVTTTRALMQAVYRRQASSFLRGGHCLDVDWIQVMVAEGLKIETFGL